jgi:hypothetical protein
MPTRDDTRRECEHSQTDNLHHGGCVMPYRPENPCYGNGANSDGFDPNDLLHPAQAFEHPSHVVNDPDLTLNEKRAILSAWASDACAVDSEPGLRRSPSGERPVPFDDVMDALRLLDKQAAEQSRDSASYRRLVRRQRRLGREWPGTGQQSLN